MVLLPIVQIEKFSHFYEVLVGSASPIRRIILQTGVDCAVVLPLSGMIARPCQKRPSSLLTSVTCVLLQIQWRLEAPLFTRFQCVSFPHLWMKPKEQLKKFETLKQGLQLCKVDFTWNFITGKSVKFSFTRLLWFIHILFPAIDIFFIHLP
ncbi:hypothetical protein EmuJ_000840400 [Echinococcus multilocularis]|uniref:Uncharacterized protein n=1 Tax=Echinococcus multilocularis TaxID=6211 RepID=A0A068YEM9_ECHMU|nr:hypothetical protein EmuJ_000840400 [Echinococcus multilocularis]